MFALEPVSYSEEFRRIEQIPRRVYTDAQILEIQDRMTALLKTPKGTMRLRPIQALALYEIGTYGGLLGPIGVGRGKELICFLAPYVLGAKHPLLLMPAHLIARSRREMQEVYAPHWRIVVPEMLSFQMLGQASHAGHLAMVPPDAIIVNESHYLKNPRAAVSRRYRRHVKEFPDTKVVNVSGTLLTKSVMDFGPLVRHCVKPCPLPTNDHVLQEWADAVDEKVTVYGQRSPGALLRFCNEEELAHGPVIAARKGLRRRLTETAGVIASGDDDVTVNGEPVRLVVRALEYDQDPVVEKHFETLRGAWETPDGWAFDQAMGVWMHARTLALGLHYTFETWPPGSGPGGVKGPWMMARSAWCKYVREAIKSSRAFDSEKQVALACVKHPVPEWTTWQEIRPTFTPVTKAVWHCTGALEAAAKWGRQGPGVIWTDHTKFAHELERMTGFKYFGQGGVDKTGLPIEQASPRECVIASRHANSTGRNIQFWDRALVTAAPMNAKDWEQMLGRFHRDGQKSEEVTVDVLLGCREHWEGWTRSLALADMTRDLLGAPQKILLARSEFPTSGSISIRSGFKWQATEDRS